MNKKKTSIHKQTNTVRNETEKKYKVESCSENGNEKNEWDANLHWNQNCVSFYFIIMKKSAISSTPFVFFVRVHENKSNEFLIQFCRNDLLYLIDLELILFWSIFDWRELKFYKYFSSVHILDSKTCSSWIQL